MKRYILLLQFLFCFICYGQVTTYYVQPIQTDASYSSTEDSSAISINSTTSINKLFLFIGGTNSSSSKDYNALRLHTAKLGIDFINLSYLNSVAAASLKNSNDSLAFNKFRQEICFGTANSDAVLVDSLNSIYTRTVKLLKYLKSTRPSENWSQYLLGDNTMDWSKIIVGGHSQGAGHAAYLAKKYRVERVLLFSGPNDYSDHFSNSANWLRQPGKTPVINHFAYLSLNDEVVDFSKQFTNLKGLGMLMNDDSTHIDPITSPFMNSHFLYTTQKPGIVILNHNVPIKLSTINNNVWTYLLTSTIITDLNEQILKPKISLYPNPVSSILHLKTSNIKDDKTYTLRNLMGKEIVSGYFDDHIDLSLFKAGIYYLQIDDSFFKIVKQ